MAWQAAGSGRTGWLDPPERPDPQGCDRLLPRDGSQADGEVARRWARFIIGLVQDLAYGTQILDVAAAVVAIDKVAEQPFSVGVVQGPVNKR
ncbi:MAG TPA: hypothetical protein VNB87_16410 [Propionibacteriaceae bacterium]|nr:hypothetical protein [Propionibacteriaceae bacterium]